MAVNSNYVVRETAANLTRNPTLTVASVLTVFVSLAIVGTTVLVRQGAQNMTRRFEGGVEFIVYVEPDITEAQLKQVEDDLQSNPRVKRIDYLDVEETWADFRELFAGDETMLENVRKTDLPTSFRVEPTDKSPETVESLVKLYRKRPNVYDVKAATEVIREIQGFTTFVNSGLSVFAIVLSIASSLLILNTIRTAMFARRREIEVMKLVGATNWFIRVPFMLEGLIQGLIGGIVAVGFVFVARNWLDHLMNQGRRLTLLRSFTIESGDVLLACVAVMVTAVLISVTSSVLATRRFLNV